MHKFFKTFLGFVAVCASLPALSATMYGYVKNDTPAIVEVTLSNDGAVFGGGASGNKFSVQANSQGSGSANLDDGLVMSPFISPYVVGGNGPWSNYFCVRWSGVSFADAATKPCETGNIYKTGNYPRTPFNLYLTRMYLVLSVASAPGCSATTVRWGPSNYCSAPVGAATNGAITSLTNATAGATGSASATCSNSVYVASAASCTSNLAAPTSLVASDATTINSISVSWGATAGTSTYRLQQRKTGATTWTDLYAGGGTAFNWTGLTDESVFEFQVRSENPAGNSTWSPIELGSIRPTISPVFVSQAGIPAKIGVSQSFTFTQIWNNTGTATWTGGTYGTAHHAVNGAIEWGIGFTAFPGSTSTNASVTTSLTATAPATPGTYTLQRIMQKSGVAHGEPSTAATVIVYDTPKCTAVNTDVATTFNPNGTITATLANPSSIEAASVRVWGEIQGEANGVNYQMTFNGANWVVSFPVAAHLTAGEVRINLKASVTNSVFAPSDCASTSVVYQQLPLPLVTVTPTFGTFGDASRQGYVVNRAGGEFAKISVDLGSLSSTLKARVEVLDPADSNLIVALNSITANQPTSVLMSSATMSANPIAWQHSNATLRISYADSGAAGQGKVVLLPIAWAMAPGGLVVNASGIKAAVPTVNAAIAPSAGAYSASAHGAFSGYLRVAPNAATVGSMQDVGGDGTWSVAGLDYNQLYSAQLVAVARSVPPAGINLLNPLEFVSAAFGLPVQAPLNVAATDGTRENDVQIVWPAVATGSAIRYRVFRDAAEITPASGISALELIDLPPVRGTTYEYTVKTMINNVSSQGEAMDTGFVPACRAARLIGASLNADMSAINGLIERWECLEAATGAGAVDAGATSPVDIVGGSIYRSFSYTLDPALADGSHVLRLGIESGGVTINANRTYDIPFVLGRASISLKSLTILYDGSTAQPGLEASSIGRFGVRMDGGSGLGFAEEIK